MTKVACHQCRGNGWDVEWPIPCSLCGGLGTLTIKEPIVLGSEEPTPATSKPSNVTEMKFNPSKIGAAADYMERNMGEMIRYFGSHARLQRERYTAFLSVGFTENQALELLKTPMV